MQELVQELVWVQELVQELVLELVLELVWELELTRLQQWHQRQRLHRQIAHQTDSSRHH